VLVVINFNMQSLFIKNTIASNLQYLEYRVRRSGPIDEISVKMFRPKGEHECQMKIVFMNEICLIPM